MLRPLSALAILLHTVAAGQTLPESLVRQLPPFERKLDAHMQGIIEQMNVFNSDSAMVLIGGAMAELEGKKDLEPRYYLLAYRAEVLYYEGAYNEAIRDLTTCADIAERLNDSLLLANVFNLQGLLQENFRHGNAARAYLRKALTWYPTAPAARYPITELFHIHGNLGTYLTGANELDSALIHLNRSLELSTQADARRAIAVAHGALGDWALARGLTDTALHHFRLSFQVAKAAAQLDVSLDALIGIAKAFAAKQDRPRTRSALTDANAFLAGNREKVGLAAERDHARNSSRILESMQDLKGALEAHQRWSRLDSTINEGNIRAALSTQATLHRTDADLVLERERSRFAAETLKRVRLSRSMVIAGALVILLFLTLLVVFLHNKRKVEKRLGQLMLAQVEQGQVITELRIREQVGRDMHDDLGAGLSALKLRSEMALRVEQDPEKRVQLSSLAKTAGELIGNMRQIIWAMNGDQASLEDLVVYATNYMRTYMAEHNIQLTILAEGPWPDVQFSSEQRRNIFLVIKEATHNIVKHANAGRVELKIHQGNGLLNVSIHDDGNGIPHNAKEGMGNGLRNMAKRIEALHGQLAILGDGGTTVRFVVPLTVGSDTPVVTNKGSIAGIGSK
ncbi:MAG: ATP-binding protein [Flavobacteriales bacterium]